MRKVCSCKYNDHDGVKPFNKYSIGQMYIFNVELIPLILDKGSSKERTSPPSHETVLDSLASHGSSCLTHLLFVYNSIDTLHI